GSNFRHTDDLPHGANAHAVRLTSDAESDDLEVFFHQRISAPSGANQLRILCFFGAARIPGPPRKTAAGIGNTRASRSRRAVENKAIHAVEKIARELEHLLGCGRELGGT